MSSLFGVNWFLTHKSYSDGNTPATCSGGVPIKMAACGPNQVCTIVSGSAVCKAK